MNKILQSEDIPAELLQFLFKKSNMNYEDVLNEIKNMKLQEALRIHQFNIWQGKNGYWNTYLFDETKPKNRKLISKTTKEKIYDALVDFYTNSTESKTTCTLKTLYPEWLKFKSLHTNSTAYVRRIDDDWKKYYLETEIVNTPISKLDFLTLDVWAHKLIRKYNLSKKKYYNLTVIMRQCLDYAVIKSIIPANPLSKVRIESKLFVKQKKKSNETQVFLTSEQELIEAEALTDFEKSASTAPLAILLDFQLGLRLGELVSLKWSDIEDGHLYIQRTEVRQHTQFPDGSWSAPYYEISEHTKSNAGERCIYLTAKATAILEQIRAFNEEKGYFDQDYIFVDSDGRIHSRAIDNRIRKLCKSINIAEKSTHKIRKTFISALIDSGLNINFIREVAGHEDERTTYRNYCYNRLSTTQTESIMDKALCC